jgi:hypothetical protein
MLRDGAQAGTDALRAFARPLTKPQPPGSNPAMRADLLIAMVLGAVAAFLAVAGFFVFEWSPILVGLLVAVMVAADGYFVRGIIRQNQETRDSAAGRRSPPVP